MPVDTALAPNGQNWLLREYRLGEPLVQLALPCPTPGIEFSPGFEFVLQIASEAKAQLNIVNGGTIFLAKNAATQAWEFYCDFY